jgi:hypothetical protein
MDYDEAAFLKPLTLEWNYTACTNSKIKESTTTT